MFSYTIPGQIAGKRLRVTKTNPYVDQFGHTVSQTGVGDLNMTYSYNNEGKPTNVTYPTDANNNTPAFNYSYDSMGRLAGATDQNSSTIVSNVQYNVANQLTAINYYGATETRSYNTLLQLTNITTNAGVNLTYNYAAGSNNGKIGSLSDAISGETVSYQYDSLNRLISAAGNGWTQTQSYDGFGNLTARTGTGTAQSTTISTPADPATNRLTGYYYDANGNQISTGYTYDAENRIVQANAGAVLYAYDAQNKRIWQANISNSGPTTETVTLFGADGKQIATYQPQSNWTNSQTQITLSFFVLAERAYFGGKLVGQATTGTLQAAVQDRLGSVGKYYPYGEERNAAPLPNDQVKFATYTRDSATGLDYADQRYYASTFGRFMTPDPYKAASGGALNPASPMSWNHYAYVTGDPVGFNDPTGNFECGPDGQPCDPGCDPWDPFCYPYPIGPPIHIHIPVIEISCDIKVYARKVPGLPEGGYHTYIVATESLTVDGVPGAQFTQTFEATDQPKGKPSRQCTTLQAAFGGCYLNNISDLLPAIAPAGSPPPTTPGVPIWDSGPSSNACATFFGLEIASGIYPNNTVTYNVPFADSNSFTYTLLFEAGVPKSTLDSIGGGSPVAIIGWGFLL